MKAINNKYVVKELDTGNANIIAQGSIAKGSYQLQFSRIRAGLRKMAYGQILHLENMVLTRRHIN